MGKVIELFRGKDEKHMASIFDVANYFILKSNAELENPMTPLKLQKLCYYAQAWSMVWDNEELFPEEFQAWVHGPANYNLYRKYAGVTRDTTIESVDAEFQIDVFSEEQIETLNTVWEAYGKFSGSYLEQLTHQEQPWKNVRENLPPGMGCDRIIPKSLMKEYYTSLNV